MREGVWRSVWLWCTGWPKGDPKMDPIITRLFEDANDFQLIDGLFVAIDETSNDIPRPQQIVRTVWHAGGVIDNSGFEAFFQTDIRGEDAITAFEEFGAIESAEAVKKALTVFPNSEPPTEWHERQEFLGDLSEEQEQILHSAAITFYRDEKRRLRKLADYVRSHRESFKGLQAGWVAAEYLKHLNPWPAADASPREIALWVLGLRGHVRLPDSDGEVQFFNSLHYPLPEGEIVISEIGLSRHRRDTDKTLGHIVTLTSLRQTLVSVSFQETDFSLDVISHLAKLPALKSLDLSKTAVKDSDLVEFAKLQLQTFKLKDTSITDEGVKHLAAVPTLQELHLAGTGVSIRSVDHLSSVPHLEQVEWPGHLLTDDNVPQLIRLSGIKRLDACRAWITNSGLQQLAKLENLEVLQLESPDITSEGLVALNRLNKLKELVLWYTNVTDDGLKHLESATQLQKLNLNSTSIGDAGLKSISKLKNLTYLDLDSTKVTDDGIAELETLHKLETLSLYETAVGDVAMSTVGKLTNLRDLSLSNTQVTDEGFARLSNLTKLRELGFRETNVTDKSIPVISKFREIRRMYTSDLITPQGRKSLERALTHWR